MDTAKERLKVICLTLAAVLLAIWILNQALSLGRDVSQVVGEPDIVPTATPIATLEPVLAAEPQAPEDIVEPQQTATPKSNYSSAIDRANEKDLAKSEEPTVKPSPKPLAVATSPTGYIDCVMEVRTRGFSGFSGRIDINGNDYSLEQFFPDDWILILSRESCADSRPAEPLSDRPNCIRQALNLINRNYGLETGSSSETKFAGVLAIDLCYVEADEGL